MLSRYLILIFCVLAGTSRAYLHADGNLFEPYYAYDEAVVVPDHEHRAKSPYENLSEVVAAQKLPEPSLTTSDKPTVKIESRNSEAEFEEIRDDQSKREDLESLGRRHMSGLENYIQEWRNSLSQASKYDLDKQAGGNLLQRHDEEQRNLASLVMSGRRARSKVDEIQQAPKSIMRFELKQTNNHTCGEKENNGTIIDNDIDYHSVVELMHKRHVLFVESRRQDQMNVLGEEFESSEISRQEANAMACGPRNYIRDRSESGAKTQQIDDFPSHAGLYLATNRNATANNLNFLCGATWFHDRFVLTLASCLEKVELDQLMVRLGEWNIGRQTNKPTMVLSRVDKAFKFPHYIPNLHFSHNLALLRLASTSSQLDYRHRLPHLTPACFPDSPAMRHERLDCHAPGRRTTTSEYLDLDGDGEIKTQHSVEMVVQLMEMKYCDLQLLKDISIAPDLMFPREMEPVDQFDLIGSGVYCNEYGLLTLKSIVQQHGNQTNLIDLDFYLPWLRDITLNNS